LAGLYAETLRGLLAPRRAVPIALVAVPMNMAQHRFSGGGEATWAAVVMCAVFLLLGPYGWRSLLGAARPRSWLALRVAAYVAMGALCAGLGWWIPRGLGHGTSFLTTGVNLFITAALFWVGGWGLGRDIDLELGLRRERARVAALEREAERVQLLALRAHLDPHFLFNTLNAIAEICREDGLAAERSVLQLSALLRRLLAGARAPSWPVASELELVRDLFELHRLRDPGRFTVDWRVEEACLGRELPPLLLLPLAENAMTHGPSAGHRGQVRLRVEAVEAGGLRLSLCNPGVWAGPREQGQGLDTVRRRLGLAYGGQASLEIGPEPGSDGVRTLVQLRIPRAGPSGGLPT